jgi:predicted amidohydrolase YtcJ
MLKRYAAAGLTAIGDRAVHKAEVDLYEKLKAQHRLPVRVAMTCRVNGESASGERIASEIRNTPFTTDQGDEWLKFGPFQAGLDGGMDAGTAYMREPYGPFEKELFGISDPDNRGELFMPPDNLLTVMRAARDKGWAMTAHTQGGGAIDTLLNVFETLNMERPIAPRARTWSMPVGCRRSPSLSPKRWACSWTPSRTGCISTALPSAKS